MTDEELNFADEVSDFLQRTCPRRMPWQSWLTQNLGQYFSLAENLLNGAKCKTIPLNTGSTAEFCIDPMLSCVGDVDIMYHYSNELAVPRGHPPPKLLPADFENRVKIYDVIDSHLPCYVYLTLTYELSKSSVDGKYVAKYVKQPNAYLNHVFYMGKGAEIHGPAWKDDFEFRKPFQSSHIDQLSLNIDKVPCIRCLQWPSQGAAWPSRRRDCGWPDSATIDAVVRSGCDVVGVAHPLCKHDEWMEKHQWRLSFSRAEIILLNSWTREQQILYHMLRTFMKTERLTLSCKKYGVDTFSNYHVKTLMLWACELRPRSLWKHGIVGICVKMLYFLYEWLTTWHGQHYFISDAYFSDYFDIVDIETISAVAKSTTVDSLAQWFVDNYICKCAELCPENIPLSCSDVVTKKILHDSVIAILKWRDHVAFNTVTKELFTQCLSMENIYRGIPFAKMTDRYLVNIPTLFSRLTHLKNSTSIAIFYYLLSDFFDGFSEFGEYSWMPQFCSNLSSSVSALTKAITFMKFTTERKRNASEILNILWSEDNLLMALRCKDSDIDSIYCLANVYLAVLYYSTGQYQKAIDHCTVVTRSQDHSKCSKYVLGELFPKFDDEIDNALGLAVFYQYVQTAALSLHRTKHVSFFTTEILAHYFITKRLYVRKCCLSSVPVTDIVEQPVYTELRIYRNRLLHSKDLCVSDLLLCKLPICSHLLRRTRNTFPWTNVDEPPAQFSIEYAMNVMRCRRFTLNRSVVSSSISSITEFLPLYLYRCKFYDRCMELCKRKVHDLIDDDVRLCTTYYEFIQLMDNDIVSLVGLSLLVDNAGLQSQLTGAVTVSQLVLSLYLLTQSRIKLYYASQSATREAATREALAASLAEVLSWIEHTEKSAEVDSFDHLILNLTERKAVIYVKKVVTRTISTYSFFDEFIDFLRMMFLKRLRDTSVPE